MRSFAKNVREAIQEFRKGRGGTAFEFQLNILTSHLRYRVPRHEMTISCNEIKKTMGLQADFQVYDLGRC
jgi:hypothetical protein